MHKALPIFAFTAFGLFTVAGTFASEGDQLLARVQESPAAGKRDVNVNAFGTPAPTSAADRRIELKPGAKWVNVTGGETVTFLQGGKSFTWRFDPWLDTTVFNLGEIAPGEFGAQNVRVYVAPGPQQRTI